MGLSRIGSEDSSGGLVARTVHAGFWAFVQALGRYAVSTLTFILLARWFLGREDFGLAALVLAITNVLQILMRGGLQTALVQAVSLTGTHWDTAFWCNLVLAAVAAAGLYVFSPPIATLFQDAKLATVLRASSPLLLLSALSMVPEAMLTRSLQYKALAVRTAAASLLAGPVGILIAWGGGGVWSLVGMQYCSAIVGLLMLWRASGYRCQLRFSCSCLRGLMPVALPMIGVGLVAALSLNLDQILLGAAGSTAAVGAYSVAKRVAGFVQNTCLAPVTSVLMPAFSKIQHDEEKFSEAFVRGLRVASVLGCSVFGVVAGEPALIIEIVLGSGWEDAAAGLFWLSLAGVLYTMYFCINGAMTARGRTGIALLIGILGAAGLLFGAWIEVPTGSTQIARLMFVRAALMACLWMAAGFIFLPRALLPALRECLFAIALALLAVIAARALVSLVGASLVLGGRFAAYLLFAIVIYGGLLRLLHRRGWHEVAAIGRLGLIRLGLARRTSH